ncbi:MAG: DAK2 domain-containing protein [Firmicutes bacterium]|nr:DAK2 domain-containing protein [Bacillota bacterium]
MNLDLIDGPKLKKVLAAGVETLVGHKEEVDALNVFPVPDGDTGTNMSLTFQAALREAEKATDEVPAILERAAQGALMGARGNSGVIVSQFFRGFARAVGKAEKLGIPEIAKGIAGAANTAYQAVRKPVEGTILTVVREAGEKAQKLQGKEKDLIRFMDQVYQHAEKVLAKTPEMLPTLKQAGVVDAGGKGLLFFFAGVIAALKGQPVTIKKAAPVEKKELFAPVEDDFDPENITFQYCTEFILRGENLSLETIKEDLAPHGDSMLVVGDEKTVKIHIHTNNPGLILDYAVHLGELSEIDINNMVEQSQQRLEKLRRDQAPQTVKEIGLVAVASGEGLQNIFRSLGVDEVIEGGQTMNPSTEDLYHAVMKVPAKQVIILPNNGNIVMTAGQVSELTDIPVVVVPSKSIPQGVAALMAFAPEESLVNNQEAMTRALSSVVTGEITFAVRSSSYNGLEIQEGDIIGLKEGDITCKGKDASAVLLDLLSHCVEAEDSFITIYYGHDINEKEAEGVLEKVQALFPEAEVELYYGGQPLYYYLFSVE